MNAPPAHKPHAQLPTWVVVALTIMVIIASILYVFISLYYPYRGKIVEETLIVPVNTERLTTNQYSEWVTITISGQGQIDSNTTHGAFYEYNTNGSVNRFNGFTIDGQPLIGRGRVFALSAPTPINPLIREYRFLYHVGDEARRIKFLIDNGNPEDNSSFIINITSRNLVDSPGR